MEKMKPSRFNVWLGLSGTVFNSFSRGYGRLTPEGARVLDAVEQRGHVPDDADPQTLQQLMRGCIIVPYELDEIAALKVLINRQRFSRDHLSLILCPTLDCNLRCAYCYESRNSIRMTEAIANSLVSFAESRMKGARVASVLWYGGEPLLELGVISRVQENLLAVASRERVQLTSSIITNGVLLDEVVAQRLRALRVTRAQVTLDGPAHVHDARRPTADGRGTYGTIMSNLRTASRYLDITIRVNIDKTNRHLMSDWLSELTPLCRSSGVRVHFARVEPVGSACISIADQCFAEQEFGAIEADLQAEALRLGVGSPRYPSFSAPFCSALADNSFLVEPDGSLQKCLLLAGSPSSKVGRLTDEGDAVFTPALYPWLALDPVPQGPCTDCSYLPICMGGCPAKRISGEIPTCTRYRTNLADFLRPYAERD